MNQKETRQQRWFETALAAELGAIAQLSPDLNIHKPNNPFWQSLFRIGGLAKAGFIDQNEALAKIEQACGHMNLSHKVIAYQWQRAYRRARARRLQA